MQNTEELLTNFAIALFIGALIGIDRERKQLREGLREIAGIRTFTLFALSGGLSAFTAQLLSAPSILTAGLICLTALVIAGYLIYTKQHGSVGLTTEISAVVTFMLGAAAVLGQREIAVSLAIATSFLLAYRDPIHIVIGKIAQDDIYASLKLLAATFIILPILPDRTVDPWGVVNLYNTWLLVILISALSFAAYLCAKWQGEKRAVLLSAAFGGLVSSTAVTFSLARAGNKEKNGAFLDLLAAGILLSWLLMFLRVAIEVLFVYSALLTTLSFFIIPCIVITGIMSIRLGRVSYSDRISEDKQITLTNPFSIFEASKFAVLFCVLILLIELARLQFDIAGVYLISGLAGLTDVDAITLSMSGFAARSGDSSTAALSIALAAVSNSIVKFIIVYSLGGMEIARRLLAAILAIFATCGFYWVYLS